MKFTGKVSRTGKDGKIQIPNKVLKEVGLTEGTEVLFTVREGLIILEPIRPTCAITGTTEGLTEVKPGLYLGREGMRILHDELIKHLK